VIQKRPAFENRGNATEAVGKGTKRYRKWSLRRSRSSAKGFNKVRKEGWAQTPSRPRPMNGQMESIVTLSLSPSSAARAMKFPIFTK
jgi:hypothetical protein